MTVLRLVFVTSLVISVAACSSSSGGGSKPASTTIVVPSGAKIVCSDGSQPPCR
jgi:hypothetical protein